MTDGLSIPSFNLGRGVHSLTLSYTWTRTRTGPTIPDWVFYARRPENITDAVTIEVDVERGAEVNMKSNTPPEVLPNQADNDSGSPVVISVAPTEEVVQEVVLASNSGSSGGSGDEATGPIEVCFPVFFHLLLVR